MGTVMGRVPDEWGFRIGQVVQLKPDLLRRTAHRADPKRPRGKSPVAGYEARIVAMNPSDGEVEMKGIGWQPIRDLIDWSEVEWEDIIDDDDEVLEDDDDEIIEDDDDPNMDNDPDDEIMED